MRALTACALAVIAASPARASDDLLRRVAREEPKGLEAFLALSAQDRVAMLREGLRSQDAEVAYLAARGVSASCLSLDEVRLQASILVRRADWVRDPDAARPAWAEPGPLPIGDADLPALWRTAAATPGAAGTVAYAHRALLPDRIADLVPFLETTDPELFDAFLVNFHTAIDHSDAQRAHAARALLYLIERARDQSEPPRLADVAGDPESKESFWKLAEAAWNDEIAAGWWALRWAERIETTAEDVARLESVLVLSRPGWRERIAPWAISRLAELDARDELDDLAGGDDVLAAHAAAELAARGEPERFLELLREGDHAVADELAWRVAPDEARRRTLAQILLSEELFSPPSDAPKKQLARLGENLLAVGAAPEWLAWFYTAWYPEGLADDAVVARVARDITREPEHWNRAVVEVNRLPLLLDIVENLETLASLGDTTRVPEMLDSWDDWWHPLSLGRVRDPRVESFLRERAAAGDATAIAALAAFYGLPERLAQRLDENAREAVRARDPVAAVLASPETNLAHLGFVDDPRVRAFLRERRDARHEGRYWEATAGLAMAGDEDAREELAGLVRDARTWILDGLLDSRVLTFDRDPEWIDFWISRLDTNCCIGYHATSVLDGVYPTLGIEHDIVLPESKTAALRAWVAARRFAHSRLADGLVPVVR